MVKITRFHVSLILLFLISCAHADAPQPTAAPSITSELKKTVETCFEKVGVLRRKDSDNAQKEVAVKELSALLPRITSLQLAITKLVSQDQKLDQLDYSLVEKLDACASYLSKTISK